LWKAYHLVSTTADPEVKQEIPLYEVENDPREYKIERWGDGWHVSGKAIERAAAMTYWDRYQSIRRFHKILEAMGIDRALREAGVEPGDTVTIGDHVLEWEE